ncbi:hypothetical protein DICPUDRAFT_36683 [Dictyostelium purpureum]|uniref:GCN5-related N-acetyltransferase Rv2170-like domain-containing protein n=1 Tax=Dictyostelium purpureum TaxID=5786 RepID=F0ZRF8_DICPU|nr:uncharacterized protein DICPUDRAFT_36683 [Dictyostelium purpureum]EGC33481.1 hypothetical protein DICPUDRAFT_36683 [Dictyostelium purpureum]|eukprot:XP_003290004.1 hypothetical protein DICPUDRAFT_36683 [Dictyostelium purpureum]
MKRSYLKAIYFKNEKLNFIKVLKKNNFKQIENVKNEIKFGNSIWFVDDLESPNILFSFQLLDALIKVITNERNLEKIEKAIKSINWGIGFLNNFDLSAIDIKKIKLDIGFSSGIDYHLKNYVSSYILPEINSMELYNLLKKQLENYGFCVGSSPLFNEFFIKINDNKIKEEKIKELEKNLDGNEDYLNNDEIDFVMEKWGFKGEHSKNEFKWAVDNKLAICYRMKENYIDENGDGQVNRKLVCWNIIKSDGKTAHFYTLPDYRNKGYARKVKSKVIIEGLKRDITVFSFIDVTNIQSQGISLELGLKKGKECQILKADKL